MTKAKVVAAVDLVHKDSDRHVALEAIKLAQTHDADIDLVFVIPDEQLSYAQEYIPEDMRHKVQLEAEKELKDFGADLDWQTVTHSTHVLRGVVYERLIEYADTLPANFVVIGASRPSIKDLLIGPNAARVARHASCSVLIVRP